MRIWGASLKHLGAFGIACKSKPQTRMTARLNMTPAREPKQHFRGILHASQRHLGSIWEVGGIWRPSESGGPFSIIKMQSNRRERPFYRRVAKVGRTKYRKTHGSSATAPAAHTRKTHSPTVTQAARNPTAKRCLGKIRSVFKISASSGREFHF